jgi:large subunit ribosomal protein L10e
MKLRPSRAVRSIHSQPWARYSIKKPRKNYIKALPHTSLLIFRMGIDKPSHAVKLNLVSDQYVQIRSNSLESARQNANKHLERMLINNYYLMLLVYPHSVIREKKRATGAGADRISQGMSLSFGSPSSVAARIKKGQTIFTLKIPENATEIGREAMKRAASKLSGTYTITMASIEKPQQQPAVAVAQQ